MNYMPEVARMLGVEIGEEFDILVNETEMLTHGPYKITDNAIVDYVGCKTKTLLYGLLTGEYTLQKRPWRPKDGEFCWFVGGNGEILTDQFNASWSSHLALLSMGNCFPISGEAEKHREEMLRKIKKIRKDMVEQCD